MASTRKKMSDCVNEFSLAMYKQLADQSPSENMFLSPSSVDLVMTMVYIGARKETEEQMAKALKLTGLDRQETLGMMKRFIDILEEGSRSVTFKTANRLFPHSDSRILDEFVSTIKKWFNSDVKPLDYTSKPGESTEEINKWVEDNTDGKIKDIIPEGILNSLTALVIVNTIYFKGNWEIPFESECTETKHFTKLNGEKVNVDMMRAKKMEDVYYCRNRTLDCKVLKLSYEDKKIGMIVVLPNETDGLLALERKLDLKTLRELVDGLKVEDVDVSLPRFKLESSIQMNQILTQLGMVDAFDEDKADLSGMGNDLYVSKVYHKTFIEVNEEGTEAGAATAAVEKSRSLEKTRTFNACHPFLFMIWHFKLDVPLFIGRLTEPKAAEKRSSRDRRERSRSRDDYYRKRRR